MWSEYKLIHHFISNNSLLLVHILFTICHIVWHLCDNTEALHVKLRSVALSPSKEWENLVSSRHAAEQKEMLVKRIWDTVVLCLKILGFSNISWRLSLFYVKWVCCTHWTLIYVLTRDVRVGTLSFLNKKIQGRFSIGSPCPKWSVLVPISFNKAKSML